MTRGRLAESLALLKTATSLDPLQAWNYIALGYVRYRSAALSEAGAYYRKALELSPTSTKFHYVLGSLLLIQGKPAEALIAMQRETDDAFRQCGLPLALDALGRHAEADQALALAERNLASTKAYLISIVYAQRNDPDQAFAWLERALRQRDGDLLYIYGDPMWSGLDKDPRFGAFMKKMQNVQ
jgi:serine/threonine-protein kinase